MACTKPSLEEGGNNNNEGVETAEGHCVAVSLADLSVWCYECNAYLRHSSLEVLTEYLEEVKFWMAMRTGLGNGNTHENNGNDVKEEMEADVDTDGGLETSTDLNQGGVEINSSNESEQNKPSINKRKGHPRKLPP